jgi:uncharacterized protein YjbI with pentapeptide repeats
MANEVHLERLRQGVNVWNAWRKKEPIVPDLSGANLLGRNLSQFNLVETNLAEANLMGANLSRTNLYGANLIRARLVDANLSQANLRRANLLRACLVEANLVHALFFDADLSEADLSGADLSGAGLSRADLSGADLSRADLSGADLSGALLLQTNLANATLTNCRIYGISAWGVKLSTSTQQRGLIITALDEPTITVDNIEVAQFVYLLLHNEKIRDVIDTVGKKGVLLLGRFTKGRIALLERLREELRKRGYVPIVFNFDKPETKDFTETVRLLAGLSKFVIADITNPKSVPLELQATIPEIMVPFQPIIEDGQTAFAMLEDLQRKHDWVFPTLRYSSLNRLIETMDEEIVRRAEDKFRELLVRRAEPVEDRRV